MRKRVTLLIVLIAFALVAFLISRNRTDVRVRALSVSTNLYGSRFATLLITNCGDTQGCVFDALILENPSGQWRTNEVPVRTIGTQKFPAAISGTNMFGHLPVPGSRALPAQTSFQVQIPLPFDSEEWRAGIIYSRLPSKAEWTVRGWLIEAGIPMPEQKEFQVFTD